MKVIKFVSQLFLITLVAISMQSCFKPTTQPSDAEITANIQSSIAKDPSVSSANIKATSQNGVVTLVGDADNAEAAGRVIEIAESTPGVSDVDVSQLTVKQAKPSMDSIITAKVKGAFARDKLYGAMTPPQGGGITVDTKDGVVYLAGEADSQAQADNAVSIAKSVNGVKSVDSKITVKK